MRRSIRFEVSQVRYDEIVAYVASKKRWANAGDFARDAVGQMMERNPVGRRHPDAGATLHEPPGGQE